MIEFDPSENLLLDEADVAALQRIQYKLHKSATIAGWHIKPRDFPTGIALIHSEISEAFEAARKDLNDDHLTHRKGAEVELADALIRILDEAALRGFDIANAAREKHAYNQTREDHKLENRAKENGKKY